jgi:hypothetical protein
MKGIYSKELQKIVYSNQLIGWGPFDTDSSK